MVLSTQPSAGFMCYHRAHPKDVTNNYVCMYAFPTLLYTVSIGSQVGLLSLMSCWLY